MRRMYGTLNGDLPIVPDLPEEPKTPASTSLFVRSVRNLNFGGPRFKRSATEGVIEDFLLQDSRPDFEPLDWTILMKNQTLFKEFSANATQEDMETFWALEEAANLSLNRPKRQSSSAFPGAANKPDNKYVQKNNWWSNSVKDVGVQRLASESSSGARMHWVENKPI